LRSVFLYDGERDLLVIAKFLAVLVYGSHLLVLMLGPPVLVKTLDYTL